MSDAGNAAAQAGGAGIVDDKLIADAGDTSDQGSTAGGGAGDLSGDDGAGGAPQNWPDDWRERLAGGDDIALRALKRYGSVEGLWKKVVHQDKLLGDRATHRGAVPTLPDEPTETEIADYRKALGIPETPDGYGLRFSEGFDATDDDNAALQFITTRGHAKHLPPNEVKSAFGLYEEYTRLKREVDATAAIQHRDETRQALRGEYGAEMKRNMTIVDEFLETHGLGGPGKLLDATLPSGRRVLHDPDTMKAIVAMARLYADEDAVFSGDVDGSGKSLDEQINDLLDKSAASGGKLNKTDDQKLDDLFKKQIERDNRRGQRQAA